MTMTEKMRAGAPRLLKQLYRVACAAVPYSWRHGGRVYRRTVAFLARSQTWSTSQLLAYQEERLRRLVAHCYAHVPYYRKQFDALGIRPESICTNEDLRQLPFTDRDTISACGDALLATNYSGRDRIYATTGGTSGKPVAFHHHRVVTDARNYAFWDTLLARIGYKPGDRMVSLRNDALPGDALWDYSIGTKRLRLDAFKLSRENVGRYLDAIADSGIAYLHTYPSAAAYLLALAREAGDRRELPIRYVIATSENVYPGQRKFIERGYGARFFSMYGHSERLICAGECEHNTDYHVFLEHGIVELVDEQGCPIREPGIRGELVGTGFNNDVMPLLRYRTGDYAEWAVNQECACGRAYPLLTNVTGRWLQEMIVKPNGALVSITALNMHSDVFDAVRQFQFQQDSTESLRVRIVPGEAYSDADEARIRHALQEKLGTQIRLEFERVDAIQGTAAAKHRFLVQNLAVNMGELMHGEPDRPRPS